VLRGNAKPDIINFKNILCFSRAALGQEVKLLCRDVNKVGAALVVALPYQSPLTGAQYRQLGSLEWTHLEYKVRSNNIMLFSKILPKYLAPFLDNKYAR
jgi:hypothetical protein